jgi:hypothetical protein
MEEYKESPGKRAPIEALLKAYTNPNLLLEILWHGFSEERRTYFKKICKENAITKIEQVSGPYSTDDDEIFSIEGYKPRMIPACINEFEINCLIKEYKCVVYDKYFRNDKQMYYAQRLKYLEEMLKLGMGEKLAKL